MTEEEYMRVDALSRARCAAASLRDAAPPPGEVEEEWTYAVSAVHRLIIRLEPLVEVDG